MALLGGRIETPQELYVHKLGAALKMERTILDTLPELEEHDHVIIGAVTETEHHEIAVYEGLITKAEAMGEQDVVALLQENLEQEEATLRKAQQMSQQLAQRAAQAV